MRTRSGKGRPATHGAGLELARNIAADLRVLPFLSRRRGRGGILVERPAFDVDKFVRGLVGSGRIPAPQSEQWEAQGTLPTVSETVVIVIGPHGHPPVAVVKVANEAAGGSALEREQAALRSLCVDPRLRALQPLMPNVFADGELDGRPYLVERLVPGVEASRILKEDPPKPQTLAAAAHTIAELHQATCADPHPADERARREWIEEPVNALDAITRRGRHRPPARALARMLEEARGALDGKSFARSWVHGDYVPANVFVTPDGERVTGVVDWELADPDGLPQLDIVHFLLTTRVLGRRRELGQIVRELLIEPQLDDGERAALEIVERAIPGDTMSVRSLVLFCWLRHTKATLDKSERYPANRLWVMLNVENVLRAFA
jgi:hypothetical protein